MVPSASDDQVVERPILRAPCFVIFDLYRPMSPLKVASPGGRKNVVVEFDVRFKVEVRREYPVILFDVFMRW